MTVDPDGLSHDTAAFDRGVIEGGLFAEERNWLIGQRRCWAARSGGRYEDPDDLVDRHGVPIIPTRWSKFPEFPFASAARQASRRDVTDVARNGTGGEFLPLLAASLAWGWGTRGLGPTRLSWILNGNSRWTALPRPETNRRLRAAVDELGNGGAVAAYRLLCSGGGRIPGLGPAFFTKLLYFADRARPGPTRSLILDARLAARMRSIWQARIDQPYAEGASSPAWLWRGPSWTWYRYEVYLTFMNRVADQLSETGERWTRELVELLLFRHPPGAACDVS